MSDILHIDPNQSDGRFSRFELIGWWDQSRLATAKALVIGAGALGNEIIKNLALLGVGHILVVDFDQIEHSNLSRSVLYRESDCGRRKADAAAERAKEIYPQLRIEPLHVNVVYDLGLGPYRWADVILGGLDNREARVAINRAAAKVGKPWIDGAIERLDGVARFFDPAVGPCYECTMSEVDWKMLEARRSCALLTRSEMEQGKTPTTPTTSSVIAGIQVQEAVKLLHGLETLSGQGFVFDGTYHQSYVVNYTRLDDCPSHEALEPVTSVAWSVDRTTPREVLEHPNIAPHAICVGDHWGAGESLQSIVTRIGEMLAYQSYNVKSPLNGEAARWVEENKERLPLDRVSLLVEDEWPATAVSAAPAVKSTLPAAPLNHSAGAIARGDVPPLTLAQRLALQLTAPPATPVPPLPLTPPSPPPTVAVARNTPAPPPAPSTPSSQPPAVRDSISIVCPNCGAGYQVSQDSSGRRVRCRKCQQVFVAS